MSLFRKALEDAKNQLWEVLGMVLLVLSLCPIVTIIVLVRPMKHVFSLIDSAADDAGAWIKDHFAKLF